MAERKIEIQMAAVNAAETAAAITQSTEAVKGLNEAQTAGAEVAKKLGDETEQAAPKLDKLVGIARAEVAAQIANGIGKIADATRKMASDFEDADPELAKTLNNTAEGLDQVSSMATAAAQGFAIAGPAGAAVGAALAAAAPQVKKFYDAYVDLRIGLGEVEDSFKNLQEFEEGAADRQEQRVKRMEAAGLIKLLKDQTEATKRLSEETKILIAVEASADALNKSERDRADQAAIAGGANPDQVARQRIQDDAAAARKALEDDLDRKQKAAAAAQDKWRTAHAATEAAKAAGYEEGAIGDLEKKEKEAEADLHKAGQDFSEAHSTAPNRRGLITSRERGGIEKIDRGEEKRNQDMLNKHAEENIEMEIRIQKEMDEKETKAAAKLAEAVDRFKNASSSSIEKLAAKMNAAAKELETVKEQVKNLRNGR